MLINSKLIVTAVALAALTVQANHAHAFEGGGGGDGHNFQIEYQEDDSERRTSERRRLPVLNEVPVINSLFRARSETRTEVIIEVRPHIIRGR